VTAVISGLIVLATLAFGAVYPWGYVPLLVAAACVGVVGLIRARGIPAETRTIAKGLLLVVVAMGSQVVPVPRSTLTLLSPHAAIVLSHFSLAFNSGTELHTLSVNPGATVVALMGVACFGLYLTELPRLLSRHDLHTLPRNLIVFAVLVALIGIFGREHNNGLVYGWWQPEEGTNENGFGPFVNRNHFAGWMLMTTSLAIGVLCARVEQAFLRVKGGLRNRIVWLSTFEASRLILIAASVVVMSISLVWTMSRSAIVSFTCVVSCFAWLMARRRHVGSARRLAVVAALGGVLLVSLNWRGIDNLVQWFGDTTDVRFRWAAWQDGWALVKDFPIAGSGLSTYPEAMLYYQRNVLEVWMTHAHNDYLQLLAEGGLLVCVPVGVLIVLLALAIRRSIDSVRDDGYGYWVRTGAGLALVGMAIQETVEFSLHIPANAFLFVTLASVAMCPTRAPSAATGSRGTPTGARITGVSRLAS
jgi:O-antigen ligase